MSAEFEPILQPRAIEDRSFQIIAEELGDHHYTDQQFPVVQRVIHATADFEIGRGMIFHPDAVRAGIHAIQGGKGVVADVQMVQSGISKPRLEKWGNQIHCFISDQDVMEQAKAAGVTRAIMSMRKAVRQAEGAVFAIGNAPTALFELIRLVREEGVRPGLIVGVPVGFVSAAESKALLAGLEEVPFITNRGRKGGSPVAVAIVNALSILAEAGA